MSIYPSSNPNREGRLPQAAMANISDQENIMHSLNVIINEASPGSGTEAIAINHKCNQEDSDTTIESGKVLEPGPNLQQAKVSLRFKHSTKWLPSMKKKNSQADITQAIKDQASLGKANENETSNLPSNPRPEQKNRRSIISSKRISLTPSAFFPKRFSSLYPSNPANTLEMSMETTKLSKGPSKTPNEEVTSHVNRSPIISQKQPPVAPLSPNNSIDNPNDLSPSSPSLSPQPLFCYSSLDKNASFCSSTPSEKSTIGKSLNVFRKTTKSILFLDPNSNGSTAETFETSSHADNQLKDESLADNEDEQIEDMPLLRRSISYTDADRRNIIAYINNSNGDSRRASNYTKNIPNFNPMHITDSRIQSPCNNSSPSMKNNTSYGISDLRGFGSANGNDINNTRISNRQRSRTMDTSENPLLELASGNNSGILSSIANFVKINRASSSASLRTPPESQTQPKLSHLELVANETPSEFLQRILKLYPLTCICEVLSLENNEFSQQTLQEYLKKYYNFEDEPLDISLRKFLMLNYLPKETQQIDRVIYQFAKHYKACNPQLGFDDDTVYILTYSLIMVHTDKFNPNNKRKMTRFDFIKNVLNAIESNKSSSNFKIMNDLIMKELLGYFYDNITYCPLIKITPEQNDYALEALESNDLQYPYPHMTFLNGSFSSSSFKDYDYRKGSISSTLSIPSSSSSIVRSNSQQLLQTQPPSKKKSSSFLWSGSSMLDPYDYIVQNDPLKLDKLKLFNLEKGNIKPNCDIPFLSTINLPQLKCDVPSIDMIHEQLTYYGEQIKTDIDTVLLNNIWKTLTEKRVSFTLKIPKSKGSYLVSSKTNVVELNSSKGDEFYLTRVFKVGIINRQEITKTPNSVSSLVPVPKPDVTDMPEIGDADKENLNRKLQSIVWKPYFCILTAVGMFFYEDVASFRMRFCGVDPDNGTNTVIIEEASSKGKEMVNTKLNDPRTVIGGSTDNTGFMSFPYFKSEKNDKTDRLEKDLLTVVTTPNFTLGSDCVATRKMQNLEYDEIVNKGKLSNVSESVVTTNLCEVSSSSSEKKTSLNDKRTSNESPLQEPEKRKSRDSAKVKSRNYTFFIYGRNSKNMYMVSSLDELRSWIQSINIISTLNDVIIDYESLDYMIIPDEANGKTSAVEPSKFYEIVPRRVLTIKEKLAGYRKEKFQRESDKEVSDNITSMGDKNAATRFRDRRNTTFSGKKASSKYENLSQTAYKIDEDSGLDFTLNSNTCSQTHSSNSTQTSEYETASIDLSKDENDSRIPTDSDISLGSIETTSNQATSSLSTKSDDLHDDSHTELLEHLYSIKNLTTTMPLQKKTEEELLSTAKFLSIKLEWLWYDECKTEIITVIADLMMELFQKE